MSVDESTQVTPPPPPPPPPPLPALPASSPLAPKAPAPPSKSVVSTIGRLFVGIIQAIPTAIYGGTAAVFLGFYTQTFQREDEHGYVIVNRFIEGACFLVLAKFTFRFLLPAISNWSPGPLFGPGIEGMCLGCYYGSLGNRPRRVQSGLIVGSVAMLLALLMGRC